MPPLDTTDEERQKFSLVIPAETAEAKEKIKVNKKITILYWFFFFMIWSFISGLRNEITLVNPTFWCPRTFIH